MLFKPSLRYLIHSVNKKKVAELSKYISVFTKLRFPFYRFRFIYSKQFEYFEPDLNLYQSLYDILAEA